MFYRRVFFSNRWYIDNVPVNYSESTGVFITEPWPLKRFSLQEPGQFAISYVPFPIESVLLQEDICRYRFCFVALYFYTDESLCTTKCTSLFSIFNKIWDNSNQCGLITEKDSAENYSSVRITLGHFWLMDVQVVSEISYYKQQCSVDPGLLITLQLCKHTAGWTRLAGSKGVLVC